MTDFEAKLAGLAGSGFLDWNGRFGREGRCTELRIGALTVEQADQLEASAKELFRKVGVRRTEHRAGEHFRDRAVLPWDTNTWREGEARCREALAYFPDDPSLLTSLGVALAAGGRLDEALAAFRRAVETRPDSPGAHEAMAPLLERQGDLDAAIAAYRRAPGSPWARYLVGVHLLERGDRRGARAELKRAVELRPGFDEALQALESLSREKPGMRDQRDPRRDG